MLVFAADRTAKSSMAGALRAVTVSFIEHGIAVLRMQRGENRINREFIDAFNSCLDEVERSASVCVVACLALVRSLLGCAAVMIYRCLHSVLSGWCCPTQVVPFCDSS